jgi:hypothetical protein
LKDSEKRRAQEAKQAKAEKNNKKDGARTSLECQEDESMFDKFLIEIRQGFPLKKRRRTSVDNAKDTLENISTQTSNEGIVIIP